MLYASACADDASAELNTELSFSASHSVTQLFKTDGCCVTVDELVPLYHMYTDLM
jgi:hypothetical protein